MERYDQTFKCTCERGDVVLRTSRKPYSYGKQYYTCPCSKVNYQNIANVTGQETEDRGFILCLLYVDWDLWIHYKSSSGSVQTPPRFLRELQPRQQFFSGSFQVLYRILEKVECSKFGVGASTAHTWTTLSSSGADDVCVMTSESMDDPDRDVLSNGGLVQEMARITNVVIEETVGPFCVLM
ncbi:hypothetical protein Tco_1023392 [Tanacetum coccineum]